MKNILLIRLKSIGDILFLLPAVHWLRENFPGAKITFLTSRENAPLLEGFQEVDEVNTLDRVRFQSGNPGAILSEAFSLFRRLRRGRFSLVVDFQGYGETAWLSWLSGAPERWGNVYGPGRRWAYTRGVTRNDRIHHVDWYLSFLQQCGLRPGKIVNEFVLPEEALGEAQKKFAAHNLDAAKPTLFVQPFTSSPQKNWPLDRYLAVARHEREHGLQILFRRRSRGTRSAGAGPSVGFSGFRRRADARHRGADETFLPCPRWGHRRIASGGGDGQTGGDDRGLRRPVQNPSFSTRGLDHHAAHRSDSFQP